MTYKYLIIDTNEQSALSLRAHISNLGDFVYTGHAIEREEAVNLILEQNPDVVFLEVSEDATKSAQEFSIINELYKYLIILPKFIVVSESKVVAYEAMKYDIYDFLLKPFAKMDVIKALLKYRKEQNFISHFQTNGMPQQTGGMVPSFLDTPNIAVQPKINTISSVSNEFINDIEVKEEHIVPKKVDVIIDTDEIQRELLDLVKKSIENSTVPHVNGIDVEASPVDPKKNILCIKSYGDYRFIDYSDIVYLKADNNSTDIILTSGDSITAFKTLKHFEESLPEKFMRIHNSHIINIDYVSRIHLGNSDCYLNRGKIKLPFSKSYKENINLIIERHASIENKEE